jgi:hydrogenase maturation protease
MEALRTIVIGVGTELRGDDGFGSAVLEALRARPGLDGRVRLARCDGEPTDIIDLWDGCEQAVVVDSVRGGAERFGFVYRRDLGGGARAGAFPRDPGEAWGSAHATGVGAAVRLGEILGRLPGRLVLYAVHGRDFRLGAPLSRPVADAVPQLASRISREIFAGMPAGARHPRAEGAGRREPSGAAAQVLVPGRVSR